MFKSACKMNVLSIQFLCDDFIIEDNSDGLNVKFNSFWDMGESVDGFEAGKELLKSRVLERVGSQDLQEVWPEILERLQCLKNRSGIWRVWSGSGRIGLAVNMKNS